MNALLGGTVAPESQLPNGFGKRLNSIRVKAALTQSQLADRAGIHIVTVSRLERGHIDPSWTMVKNLAEALGVTPDAFLEGDEPQPPTQPDDPDQPDRPLGKRK